MQVGIIGVGLIGGSMAVDLKNRGFADRVVGVEADALHASAAKELGLVDEIVSYEECIAMSDMIVVAVPVSIAIRMIPDILDKVDRQVVTDVCSTKEKINEYGSLSSEPEEFCRCSSHGRDRIFGSLGCFARIIRRTGRHYLQC